MTVDVVASGSSGNCCIINNEIAIDMGISMKKLRESGYVKTLKLLLLTHAHSDHFSAATVRTLHRERPALRIGCCEWMVEPLLNAGVDKRVIDVYEQNLPYIYGNNIGTRDNSSFVIRTSFLFHDVKNCAYHIFRFPLKLSDYCEFLFYATDTGTLSGIKAKDYSYYLIESNHTEAEIAARIAEKQSRGEFAYEMRAAKYHLSHEQAMAWLAENAGPQSQYILLHQHEQRKGEMT